MEVLIVDDSAVVRQVLGELITSDPDLNLMGAVADPIFAMKRMERQWPDVIVLDIEMPRMDGLTFLKKIMSERPTPVVMCSSLVSSSADPTMQAMSYGAVDIVCKPKFQTKNRISDENKVLLDTIKSAAKAKNLKKINAKFLKADETGVTAQQKSAPSTPQKLTADAILQKASKQVTQNTSGIIAIGTSTGGTQALEAVLTHLQPSSCGMVVVQHMPEHFTKAFADRLNSLCAVEVSEAKDGDVVTAGKVLIAPGGKHMTLKRTGISYFVEVVEGPLVNRHRPSVDVLFRSVAKHAGKNALGIIMTGMGDDGARGLKEMHDFGAYTIGQDEKSCIVYGMPKEAFKVGAIDMQMPLDSIAPAIMNFSDRKH